MYNNPYFTGVPDIGILNLEEIIIDNNSVCPILFTLVSENGQRYISVCCDMYEEQRWIIVPISNDCLISLLTNKLSIRNAFFTEYNKTCVIAHWSKTNPVLQYEKVSLHELPECDLPPDEILETKQDEFTEYVLKIQNFRHKIYDLGLAQDSTELKKLLAENPDLPIVTMTCDDVCMEGYGWCYSCNVWCSITTILDCETPFKSDYVYDNENDFKEDLAEYLYELNPSKYKEIPNEDFDKLVDEEVQKYVPYWKKVIAIHADV